MNRPSEFYLKQMLNVRTHSFVCCPCLFYECVKHGLALLSSLLVSIFRACSCGDSTQESVRHCNFIAKISY